MAYLATSKKTPTLTALLNKPSAQDIVGEVDRLVDKILEITQPDPMHNPYSLSAKLRYSAQNMKEILTGHSPGQSSQTERIFNNLFGSLSAIGFQMEQMSKRSLVSGEDFEALSQPTPKDISPSQWHLPRLPRRNQTLGRVPLGRTRSIDYLDKL